jgi:hypothetical protein
MKGNLAAVIAGAICSRCRLMRGPRSKSAATRRGDMNYGRKRRRWMAASLGGLAPAGSKRSNTTDWGFPMDPTAIDAGRKN